MNDKYERKFNEDISEVWGKIKKGVLKWIKENNYKTCEIDYADFKNQITFEGNSIPFRAGHSFELLLQGNKSFNYSPSDSTRVTWYQDEAKGIKFEGSNFKLVLLFD